MANGDRPVVSLMDRVTDNPEMPLIEDDADLASPNGLSGVNPEGVEIEIDEDGGAIVDFDPTPPPGS